ncbi:helix-turn-helix transcriptional regulator [Phytomonospora sp. NPDC050363]|uniref:helix-turn-helix domain-containing protein n=1 Tax=Phytomonospora sp. NPDC050363 TaxID=3155642 RepID=UPI0033CACDF0
MSKNQTLSLRSQWLGERLRAARVRAGYTLQQVGDFLRLEGASIGRFERGTHPIRPSYVRDLIGFYGISDRRERDILLRLNEDAWRKDWWDGDTDGLDMGFIDYTWLEARARRIRAFSPLLIHGLLQTADYTRALTLAGLGTETPKSTVDRMVEVRMTRQQILTGDQPAELCVILEELALRRAIGGIEIHRAQLEHLLVLEALEHIEIRVLPPTLSWHPGLEGPFSCFELPDPYPNVAYFEALLGRTFIEAEAKVQRFQRAYDDLYRLALSARESRRLIKTILKDDE